MSRVDRQGEFFIQCKDNKNDPDDKAYFVPVMGTVLKVHGYHLIVHQDDDKYWRVSEMLTGLNITNGHESKQEAKDKAHQMIDDHGDTITNLMYHWAVATGISPMFKSGKIKNTTVEQG